MLSLSAPRRIAALAAVLALAIVGCGDPAADNVVAAPTSTPAAPLTVEAPTPSPTVAPTPTEASTPSPAPSPTPTTSPTPKPVAQPVTQTGVVPERIEIPSIGVDARVVDLAIGPGDPEVPEAWEDAGWYDATRRPGEIGPAVIAGHIDSKSGPAVFFRLDELGAGDEIILHGADGDRRTFVVESSGQYPKENLPDEVFGFGDRRPELRVITCGGTFDRSVGHYEDNLVVYAAEA